LIIAEDTPQQVQCISREITPNNDFEKGKQNGTM
jgi:hypothetical protein